MTITAAIICLKEILSNIPEIVSLHGGELIFVRTIKEDVSTYIRYDCYDDPVLTAGGGQEPLNKLFITLFFNSKASPQSPELQLHYFRERIKTEVFPKNIIATPTTAEFIVNKPIYIISSQNDTVLTGKTSYSIEATFQVDISRKES